MDANPIMRAEKDCRKKFIALFYFYVEPRRRAYLHCAAEHHEDQKNKKTLGMLK